MQAQPNKSEENKDKSITQKEAKENIGVNNNTNKQESDKSIEQPTKIKISISPESKTLKRYNEISMKYLKELNKTKTKEMTDAMTENVKSTPREEAKKLGKDLFYY